MKRENWQRAALALHPWEMPGRVGLSIARFKGPPWQTQVPPRAQPVTAGGVAARTTPPPCCTLHVDPHCLLGPLCWEQWEGGRAQAVLSNNYLSKASPQDFVRREVTVSGNLLS